MTAPDTPDWVPGSAVIATSRQLANVVLASGTGLVQVDTTPWQSISVLAYPYGPPGTLSVGVIEVVDLVNTRQIAARTFSINTGPSGNVGDLGLQADIQPLGTDMQISYVDADNTRSVGLIVLGGTRGSSESVSPFIPHDLGPAVYFDSAFAIPATGFVTTPPLGPYTTGLQYFVLPTSGLAVVTQIGSYNNGGVGFENSGNYAVAAGVGHVDQMQFPRAAAKLAFASTGGVAMSTQVAVWRLP